jgi:hypothetical protein
MPLALATIFSSIAKNWREAIMLGLFVLACVLDMRVNHWHKLADQRAATIAQVKDAQAKATIAAQQAHDAQEQRYKDLANASQTTKAQQDTVVHAAVADWADAHRVPACPSRTASNSIAGAQDRDTDIPASVPKDSVVLSGDDLQACGDAVTYALESHRWAATLNP